MATPRVTEDAKLSSNSPIAVAKLKEMCSQVCGSVISPETVYTHALTSEWNDRIIKGVLDLLVAESKRHKFLIYSTVVERDESSSTRGMHSTTGAYWNSAKDGIWNYKWGGGTADRGMDVVISIAWISLE
ncbi:Tctex-1 [Dipodascopsis tothii]|uniref:Tctex-1 n=1 Tax=Dipodascopsis tothii TaxID=44089 RepID=UPI0034CF4506